MMHDQAKEFLKPTALRLLLAGILFVVVSGTIGTSVIAGGPNLHGFPFVLSDSHCKPITSDFGGGSCDYTYSVNLSNLIIDALVWYLVACALVLGYNKLVKK